MPSTPWTQPSRLNHLVLKFPPSVYDSSVAFYTKTLATLGYVPIHNYGVAMGFGPKDGRADFWIGQGADENVGVNAGLHFAFDADDREQVRTFYRVALEAGGKDHGEPGIRQGYHASYYGAFVLDPAGNNIEAVDHKSYPEDAVTTADVNSQ